MGSRDTSLSIYTEKQQGRRAMVLVRMVDKSTGEALVGTFTPATVDRIVADLRRAADSIRT